MPGSESPDAEVVLGVDIGATKVAAGRVDGRGRVAAHSGAFPHGNGGPEAVLSAAVEALERVGSSGDSPAAIGVGVAAQVDPATGRARYAPNLRWEDISISDQIGKRFGCPVHVENDARSAALAEWRYGAGVGERNLLAILVGTGVGGGVVCDGRLLGGASNGFGEIGHSALVAGGRRCHCPSRGCLEAYVGGWAIAERARERIRGDPSGGRRLVELAGSVDRVDARTVSLAARQGDRFAESIARATSHYLASGIAGLVNAFNPGRVVLGGGVIEGSPGFVEAVSERVGSSCQPPAARAARVVRSSLGPEAVLIGAAALARERLSERTGARPSGRTRALRGA